MKNKLVLVIIILFAFGIYFIKNNINSVNVPISMGDIKAGDVNGDGKINTADYILVRKYILKTISLNNSQKSNADINSDGKVNANDYILIRKAILSGTTPASSSNNSLVYNDSRAKVISSKRSYTVINYNVVDYGADPTGVKDSTDAFQKALENASNCIKNNGKSKCGSVVYAPKGKYIITKPLYLYPYVGLIGDLEEGTTNGTILIIKHGMHSTDINQSAITMDVFSSVQNIAFWYPDQRILENGNTYTYPPTIRYGNLHSDGVTLENLYFVNSFIAMDFASANNSSILFIRDIYGTPLHIGFTNNMSTDTTKMENINFAPKYWLNSGLSNIPSRDLINKRLMATSTSAMIFSKVDWFMLANINIEGYYKGISFSTSSQGISEGTIYDSSIINCYYPINIDNLYSMAITDTNLKSNGGRAININSLMHGISINGSNISSTGDYSIYNPAKKPIAISNSSVSGRINNSSLSFTNSQLSNTGFDDKSVNGGVTINKKEYDKRYNIKPKSTNLIMIEANLNEDITSKIKSAINKLSTSGGIVYIPIGTYTISDNINVPSGIEIRGATPWAHHNLLYNNISSPVSSTVLSTTYDKNSIFTLQSNSGINGFTIMYPNNITAKQAIKYPYSVKGNGSNIHVTNIAFIGSYSGIDLASVKCDNHYIDHIFGEFYNIGINVGGNSSNGIIRDSHANITILHNQNPDAKKMAMNNQVFIYLGPSTNETVLNTFSFAPGIGYYINGAKDFYTVGAGVDYAITGIKLSGNSTGQLINSIVDTRNTAILFNVNLENNLALCHYLESTNDFNGNVNVFNQINWGNENKSTAYDLSGSGTVRINSGVITDTANPAIRVSNTNTSIHGIVISKAKANARFQFDSGASNVYMSGNICDNGIIQNGDTINNARANISNSESGGSTHYGASSTPAWLSLSLNNTIVNSRSASTTLCGFNGNDKNLEYLTNNDSTKVSNITNGCANITISAYPNQLLTYRINSNSGSSQWIKENNIGKYLLFGQVYNQLLHVGKPAYNNLSNVGAWVANSKNVPTFIETIRDVILNERKNNSNEEFVRFAYKGILGREADAGGLSAWVNQLNNGTPRYNVLRDFFSSSEAGGIYSAWGY